MTDDLILDPDFQPTKPNPWPFRFWVGVTLVAAGFLLTDLVVSGGAGGLVIDWKLGPAFIAVLGGIWGARKSRHALAAASAEDDRLDEGETEALLQEVARYRAGRLSPRATEDKRVEEEPPTGLDPG